MPWAWNRVLPFTLAFALAGCFVSEQPLISPARADYPLAEGKHYTRFLLDYRRGSVSSKEETQGILLLRELQPSTGGETKNRAGFENGRYYVWAESHKNSEGAIENSQTVFLLQRMTDDYYIAMTPDKQGYDYDLLQIAGSTIYRYDFQCHPVDIDRQFVLSGLIRRGAQGEADNCYLGTLDDLAKIFQARLADGARPGEAYTVHP